MTICDLVWNEYSQLFNAYEKYNDHSLTLKGWSVTVALAAIVAVYIERVGAYGKVVLWIAALSAVPFWMLDALWKGYQKAYLERLAFLESIEFHGVAGNCTVPSVHKLGIIIDWKSGFDSLNWISIVRDTAFPHLFVLVLGIVLAFHFSPKAMGQNKV